MYLHPDLETLTRRDLEGLRKLERLRRTVALAATTPLYGRAWPRPASGPEASAPWPTCGTSP